MKPPKGNEKLQKKVHFSERGNRAQHKECEKIENINDQKVYAFMANMSDNDERPSGKFGESFQLTNRISYSVATCHMTPEVSDFISGFLEDTDKNIEVADRHHVTAKKKDKYE